MPSDYQIRVYRRQQLCHTENLTDSVQIGRQRPDEPPPFQFLPDIKRLIVAALDDKLVSREHLQLELLREEEDPRASTDSGFVPVRGIRVQNLSRKRSVTVDTHGKLNPEQSVVVKPPVLISFEDLAIRVEQVTRGPDPWDVKSLDHPTMAPGAFAASGTLSLMAQKSLLAASSDSANKPDQLIHWLSEMMEVLQSAAGASDFLAQSVDAVSKILRLDSVSALLFENGKWDTKAALSRNQRNDLENRSPSRTILQQILDKKCTVYHVPASSMATASLQGIKALVASPILDPDGEVIGALYGARFSSPSMQVPQISELEATMVEVIACSAAAGIAREAEQQKAIEARVQFEQFFTPQMVAELESNPDLLEGRDENITVLFCDIIGFSAISQRIGSMQTMRWISDVMHRLSEVVWKHNGVVVDYIGDELMAMWGAPKPQSDHAAHACQAATELMECRASIDAQWREITGQPSDFRIGVCSGIASVGNTGSTSRLKYGPLGNTVNLASRLQNAGKQLGVKVLVSDSTVQAIEQPDPLLFRPLGTASFVNISQPTPVHELGLLTDPRFSQLSEAFSGLIPLLQESNWTQAESLLESLKNQFPGDQPTQILSERLSLKQMKAECIWPLETK